MKSDSLTRRAEPPFYSENRWRHCRRGCVAAFFVGRRSTAPLLPFGGLNSNAHSDICWLYFV